MKRFQKYLDKEINLKNIKNEDNLKNFGVKCRYLPDPPEEFDEFEFGFDFKGSQDVAFVVTIELGKIKRLLFGQVDPDNPDLFRPLPEETLHELAEGKGDLLSAFFDYITEG